MDRRVALQRIATLMGGTLSVSTVAGVLGGCSAGEEGMVFQPRTLTKGRYELVATLSELIIPETDTPGARTAKVQEFIDNMLTDWYDQDEVDEFLKGLEGIEERAKEFGGKSFIHIESNQQIDILSQMEEQAEQWKQAGEIGPTPFFLTIKWITVTGYYTSEVGATQELHLNPMGVYKADIPYSEVGRAWA
ncbi:MAG: gluconate 2-dehydrogenase subunit 3 family protein [Bacteroidetes bacterium]|nr:gluconate 2-dehydrogenase subunit 3 family protein [Bacteroidota bacterium]